MIGEDSGMMIFVSSLKSLQPSRNAASCSYHGIVFEKNVRAMIML